MGCVSPNSRVLSPTGPRAHLLALDFKCCYRHQVTTQKSRIQTPRCFGDSDVTVYFQSHTNTFPLRCLCPGQGSVRGGVAHQTTTTQGVWAPGVGTGPRVETSGWNQSSANERSIGRLREVPGAVQAEEGARRGMGVGLHESPQVTCW